MSLPDLLCGGSIVVLGLLGIVINITVIRCTIQHFIRQNSFYALVLPNIVGTTVTLCLIVGYLGTSILTQTDIGAPYFKPIGSFIFIIMWYTDLSIQMVLAVNRFFCVVLPKGFNFTRYRCFLINVFLYVFGAAYAVLSYFIAPCCKIFFNYETYSFKFNETSSNFVNEFLDMPFQIFSTIVCTVFYSCIIIYVRKAYKSNMLTSFVRARSRRREVRCAMQFAVSFLFTFLSWSSFRILPLFVPSDQLYWYAFTTIFVIFHCTVNALCFVIFNAESSSFITMSLNILSGGFFTIIGFFAIVFNLSVVRCIINNFLRQHYLYILTFPNIIGNTVNLFFITTYLGPSIMVNSDIGKPYFKEVASYFFLAIWYSDISIHIVLAFNRFCSVVHYKKRIFTRRRCWKINIFLYSMGFVCAACSDFLVSCCMVLYDHKVFSFSYKKLSSPRIQNVVNSYDIFVEAFSTFMCSIFYIGIIIYVRKLNKFSTPTTSVMRARRRRQELRCAANFAVSSAFTFLCWSSFRILPLLVPTNQPAWYGIIVIFFILHCIANSFSFVFFNTEFRNKYFKQPLQSSVVIISRI